MIVSVTALGSRDGDAAAAVARVVDYLDGRCPQPPGRSPQWWQDNGLDAQAPCDHGLGPASNGAVSYYADSVEGPGTWMGRGLAGFSPAGEVSREQLGRMLFARTPAPAASSSTAAAPPPGPTTWAGAGPRWRRAGPTTSC